VVQTYWPRHPAILAAACHDPTLFYAQEAKDRAELGYPPFGRLANVLVWGRESAEVARACDAIAASIGERLPEGWQLLGPSPAPLSRLKDVWRWHVLVKAPVGADLPAVLGEALAETPRRVGVSVAADVDPVSLL
jgi:primosomal protein N' (replication factor Y)